MCVYFILLLNLYDLDASSCLFGPLKPEASLLTGSYHLDGTQLSAGKQRLQYVTDMN